MGGIRWSGAVRQRGTKRPQAHGVGPGLNKGKNFFAPGPFPETLQGTANGRRVVGEIVVNHELLILIEDL